MKLGNYKAIYELAEEKTYEKYRIGFSDIANAATDYSKESFRGCVSVACEESLQGYAHISPEGFIYAFKMLIYSLFGSGSIGVSFFEASRALVCEFAWEFDTVPPVAEISNVAKASGFSVEPGSDGGVRKLRFVIKAISSQSFRIYAFSKKNLLSLFYSTDLLEYNAKLQNALGDAEQKTAER